jgi:hypothetical protein
MGALSLLLAGSAVPVLSASLTLPGFGAWVAEVEAEEEFSGGGAATLRVEGDSASVDFRGCLSLGISFAGRRRAYLVGGAGRLSAPLLARYYQGSPARLVVLDLLQEAGETLSPLSAGLDVLLPRWARLPGPAGLALGDLCSALALRWAVTAAGEVFITPESTPPTPYPGAVEILSADGLGRSLGLDLALPDLAPGHALPSFGEVARVSYSFTGRRGSRATAWLRAGVL